MEVSKHEERKMDGYDLVDTEFLLGMITKFCVEMEVKVTQYS